MTTSSSSSSCEVTVEDDVPGERGEAGQRLEEPRALLAEDPDLMDLHPGVASAGT